MNCVTCMYRMEAQNGFNHAKTGLGGNEHLTLCNTALTVFSWHLPLQLSLSPNSSPNLHPPPFPPIPSHPITLPIHKPTKMATPYSRHSPRSHSHQHKHHKCNRFEKSASRLLPLNAAPLNKRDFERFESLFALYLDVQKGLVFEKLGEREVRGRWRGFVGRW